MKPVRKRSDWPDVTTRLRPSVLAAREQLAEGRQRVRRQHDRQLDSVQVCGRLTSLVDTAVVQLYTTALDDLDQSQAGLLRERIALVAHGGYGRRHLAPYSDIDLMILHTGRADEPITDFVRRLTQDIFDIGQQLGHSVRTALQATQLARQDPVICTSLLESRLLAGAAPIHEEFTESFRKMVQKNSSALCQQFISARRSERTQFGETVYLLEPNIKRSRGGLRDLHLLRWLWFVKTGVAQPERLHGMGVISKFDYRRLVSARRFLLRVRNEMHFEASEARDTLGRSEQVRLAEQFGYHGSDGLRPVEQFMRDYFHHSNHIWSLAHRLSELTRPASTVTRVLDPVFARPIEKDYRIGIREISATGAGQSKLKSHVEEVLRLVDLARLYEKWIAQELWYLIYRAAPEYSRQLSPQAAERFLDILDKPLELGELLRRLHALGVLEKIVPEFAHARSLLQFNQYHKYTVDEHCIRAVEEATRFADRTDELGETYRRLGQKRTLHLALLVHDLGKGREEDHSIVGQRLAEATAKRLRLPKEQADALIFLVHKHLRMSHLAFRRDTSQPDLVRQFAEEVGSLENLVMLYLLSCADLAAVGPGVLNNWKVEVLTQLFRDTRDMLALGETSTSADGRQAARDAVWQQLTPHERSDSWYDRQLRALPENFINGRTASQIAETLRRLRDLPSRAGRAWGSYMPRTQTVEFMAGIDSGSGRGIFSSMAGVFSSRGIEILSADAATLADGLLLQCYVVRDTDHPHGPPEERLAEIGAALVDAIDDMNPPVFRTLWGREQQEQAAALSELPQDVRIDDQLSPECTIIEIFTVDRHGLLFQLARALHELRLVIRFAKIGTYLDQVVDVFYVTERDGQKPQSPQRLDEIRTRLTEVIGG